MTTPLNNKKGTTLVELMVCLVLLALLGVAAVTLVKPSAEAYISVQQLTRAQNLADALTETIRGELANADGTLAIVEAATNNDTRDSVFTVGRSTQGSALLFTVENNYVEVLDAGYVPELHSSKTQTDAKKKYVYIPPKESHLTDPVTFPELQGYLHMRFYETADGAVKHQRAAEGSASGSMLDCAYAYTTAYPNGDYMGLVISNLTFYARGWEHQTVTTSENKKVDKICLTSLTMQLTISDPKTGNDIYTQTAVIPLPGSPEFN